MKDQLLQHKLPLQPTSRHEARSSVVGWNRDLFGQLPRKQTLSGDFFLHLGVRNELPVKKETKFGS
jgi:hypothetical protein